MVRLPNVLQFGESTAGFTESCLDVFLASICFADETTQVKLYYRNARSSAKSRSSNWEKRVHWIPLGLSDVVNGLQFNYYPN